MRRALLIVAGFAGGCSAPNPLFGHAGGTAGGGDASGSGAVQSGAGDEQPTMTAAATGDGTAGASDDADPDGSTDGPEPTPSWVLEDDEWRGEFSEGETSTMEWSNEHFGLSPGLTHGTFLSRVHEAGEPGVWRRLRWIPRAPYGKPLPDGGAQERGYELGNVDMADNVLLVHFDEIELLENGDAIADHSGHGHHGVAVIDPFANATLSGGEGVVGRALEDPDPGNHVRFESSGVAPGVADFTMSLWVSNFDCSIDQTFLALDSADNTAGTSTVWIGCNPCPDEGGTGGFTTGIVRGSAGAFACALSEAASDPARWHHVALVKTGHPEFTARLFVDGQQVVEFEATLTGPLAASNDVDVYLGGQGTAGGSPFQSSANFDEVAIWHRALDDEQIKSAYARGAQRMLLSVRACQEPECADDPPFVGPDGTQTSTFADPADSLAPGTMLPVPDLAGAYVQYQLVTQRLSLDNTPALFSVTVEGDPR